MCPARRAAATTRSTPKRALAALSLTTAGAAEKALAIAAERAHVACGAAPTRRVRRETVTFQHPFRIRGIDRELPAGAYEVITDEETIEGLSFEVFRRVATMIIVPVQGARGRATEMLSIGSVDLADAQRLDASASHG